MGGSPQGHTDVSAATACAAGPDGAAGRRFAFHVGCPLVRGSKDAVQKFLQVGGSNKIGDLKTTLKGGHCVK
jgi:hypothetical protein